MALVAAEASLRTGGLADWAGQLEEYFALGANVEKMLGKGWFIDPTDYEKYASISDIPATALVHMRRWKTDKKDEPWE